MKARRIKQLDTEAPLADAAERIVSVRLDELLGFLLAALDPVRTANLHDLRIAAKRLRYVLELCAFCFGPYAATAAKRAKELQDLLGEVHDCDVMLPRVLAEVGELRVTDAALIAQAAGPDLCGADVPASAVAGAPGGPAYRGLEVYAAYLQARRAVLFARFVALWQSLEREGFAARLRYAVGERPAAEAVEPATPGTANGAGEGPVGALRAAAGRLLGTTGERDGEGPSA